MSQSFALHCPGCSVRLKFQDSKLAGRKIRCPKCQHAFRLPPLTADDPPAQASAPPPAETKVPADESPAPADELFSAETEAVGSDTADDLETYSLAAPEPPEDTPPPVPRKKRRSGDSSGNRSGSQSKQRKSKPAPQIDWKLPALTCGSLIAAGLIGWMLWPGGPASETTDQGTAPQAIASNLVDASPAVGTHQHAAAPHAAASTRPQDAMSTPELAESSASVPSAPKVGATPPAENAPLGKAEQAARDLESNGATLTRGADGSVTGVRLGGRARDADLALLASLPNLHELTLRQCNHLTDNSLKALVNVPSLRSLTLARCEKLSTSSIIFLRELPNLDTLIARDIRVGNPNVLEYVGELQGLKRLDLHGSPFVRSANLEQLARLPRLESLDLSGTNLKGSNLDPLRSLTALRSLDLSSTGIRDDAIDALVDLRELRHLALKDCEKLTHQSLDRLRRLPKLQVLNLEYCVQIGDNGLFWLKFCPALQELNLDVCTEVSDAGLENLHEVKTLELLILASEYVRYPQNVRIVPKYTPAGVQALQQALPQCRVVIDYDQKQELRDVVRTYADPQPPAAVDAADTEQRATFASVTAAPPMPAEAPSTIDASPAPAQTPPTSDAPPGRIEMQFVRIEAGEFRMGLTDQNDDPPHQVTITRSFDLGVVEVTQSQWEAVMHTRPWRTDLNLQRLGADRQMIQILGGYDATISQLGGVDEVLKKLGLHEGPNFPATNMTWAEAVDFCNRLSRQEGVTCRLPTEAEWEHACRAGTKSVYFFGDDREQFDDYAWHTPRPMFDRNEQIHEVGTKLANPWGLFDIYGNASEWCLDGRRRYEDAPAVDPVGPADDEKRMVRGGSYKSSPTSGRSAVRGQRDAVDRHYETGFRVLREVPQ